MCLGVPAKVIEVIGDKARVACGTVEYTANIGLLDEVVPGDFILLHAGFGIAKIEPVAAEETFKLIREILDHDQEGNDG